MKNADYKLDNQIWC